MFRLQEAHTSLVDIQNGTTTTGRIDGALLTEFKRKSGQEADFL